MDGIVLSLLMIGVFAAGYLAVVLLTRLLEGDEKHHRRRKGAR